MNERSHHDEFYAADAARIFGSPLYTYWDDRAAREFRRATGLGPDDRVLSLGCGEGSMERRIAPWVREVVGLDISPVGVRIAQEKARAAGLHNARFLVADLTDPKLAALGPFDGVAAFSLLHHLPDEAIERVLRSARGALSPGGVFYSSDPNVRRFVALFKGLVRGAIKRYHSPDERELDPAELRETARRAGFATTEVGYVDWGLGPIAWLAPGVPGWLVPLLAGIDNVLTRVPLVRSLGSTFCLIARAPAPERAVTRKR